MIQQSKSSFLARIACKFFRRRVDWEIFHNLFPHLEHESDEGYAFTSDHEMVSLTDQLDVQNLLEDLEGRIGKLPKAYGECLRYIMHRDLCERMRLYLQMAKQEHRG